MKLDAFIPDYEPHKRLPVKLSKKSPKKLPNQCVVDHDCEGEVRIRETNRKGVVIPLCDKHYKRLVKVGLDINLFMSGGK